MATAVERLGIITSLVRKTTAFKGGFSAKILRASTDIRDIMDTLVSRNESDEVRRLRADNGRLQREVANMRAEVAALRSGFEEARREVNQAARAAEQRAGAPAEEERLMERLEASIAKMIDGRLAELKTCLPRMVTRPPLAGDSSRVARATRAAIAEASGLSPALLPKRTGMEGRRRESAEEGMEWGPSTSAVPDEFPELPGVEDGPTTSAILVDGSPELPWVEVGRRSKGKGKGKKSKPKPEAVPKGAPSTVPKPTAAPTGAPKSVPKPTAAPAEAPTSVPKESPKAAPLRVVKKLSAPSSSAVILKLQPEAVQNGATYSSALLKAEQEVNLEELGIGSLRIRPSATGARLIEVPGSSSSGKADALASALKVALAGVVDVFRPVKTADFRVTGLNDAATAQRIKAAVAQAGSCTEDQVWVGEIRSDWRGSGSALMRCPVTTAKKLIEAGSLTVGWSRVQLRHLEARPMHCYKCMGKGHTASLCPSQTDRSRLCYRCGEAGHLSASCTAEPRCAVCRDAGKPAGHVMGGRACNPPPIRGKGPSPPPREGRQGEAPVGQMEE
ncbi:transcriptional regulatory protein AlgP-like [Plodia interpunctella]|nr:transcriptional regulatory protein AlgP-like [Plodia interpunctella]